LYSLSWKLMLFHVSCHGLIPPFPPRLGFNSGGCRLHLWTIPTLHPAHPAPYWSLSGSGLSHGLCDDSLFIYVVALSSDTLPAFIRSSTSFPRLICQPMNGVWSSPNSPCLPLRPACELALPELTNFFRKWCRIAWSVQKKIEKKYLLFWEESGHIFWTAGPNNLGCWFSGFWAHYLQEIGTEYFSHKTVPPWGGYIEISLGYTFNFCLPTSSSSAHDFNSQTANSTYVCPTDFRTTVQWQWHLQDVYTVIPGSLQQVLEIPLFWCKTKV
jgi:hypothetical protein